MAMDNTGDAVNQLPPLLAAQLDYALNRSPLHPLQMRVESVRKGFSNARFADRFSLLVPCCLDYIKWDVVYNCQYPWLAPDVIFSVDDENFQPFASMDENNQGLLKNVLSILRDWSIKDPSKLLQLIIELRTLYLQYQRKLVEEVEDSRVRFEIGTISNIQGLEMCLVNGADKSQEVKFAVPLLKVDLSQLLRGHSSLGRHQPVIYLQVVYTVRKGLASMPMVPLLKLYAQGTMKEVFDVEEVKLPIWPDGMCLAEYIPTLKDTLRRQVHDAFLSVSLRRSFMEALFLLFGRPLEAETIFCRRVSVLASSGIFVFVVHFSLPIQFPKQQPILTFQSSQHFDTFGKPITRLYKDYPWSTKWDTVQMVQRIFDFVVDECNLFKKYCNDALQHH